MGRSLASPGAPVSILAYLLFALGVAASGCALNAEVTWEIDASVAADDSAEPSLVSFQNADMGVIPIARLGSLVLSGSCAEEGGTITLSGALSAPVATICVAGAWSESVDVQAQPDGMLTFAATAALAGGLTAEDDLRLFKDTQAPVAPSLSVAAPGVVFVDRFGVSWSSAENGLAGWPALPYSVDYYSDMACGALVGTAVSSASSLTVASVPDGSYSIRVSATDAAGNSAISACFSSFATVDTAAASFQIAGGAAYAQSASNSISIAGAAGAQGYCLTSSPSAITSSTEACTGSAWVSAAPVAASLTGADGVKTLYLWVADATGGVKSGGSRSITLDSTGPSLSLGSLTGGQQIVGGYANAIVWTATDAGSGIDAATSVTIAYSTDGGATWSPIATGIGNSGTYNWTPPAVNSSTFRVRVTVTDRAGNPSSFSGSNFSVFGAPAILVFSDASVYDFGSVPVSSSGSRGFTVTNTGQFAASGVYLSLASATRFSLSGNGCGTSGSRVTIAGGATCVFSAVFSPVAGGLVTDSVTVTYDDGVATGVQQSEGLQGTGTNLAINPTGVTLQLGGSQTFVASGGTPPYSFALVSGVGSVGALTGVYSALHNPGSATIRVTDSLGVTTTAGVTVECATLAGVTVDPIYPVNGSNWNTYVRNYGSGTSPYDRSDAACLGTELGYTQCMHAGEKKKIVVVGQPSCSGLSIADALGAFEWTCDDSSGTAKFYSVGLRQGKGLSDLLAGPTSFLSNSVTVTKSGCGAVSLVQTSSVAWWSNPVQPLPSNPGVMAATSLNAAGTIYTFSGGVNSSGYNIGADRVAIVGFSGAKLTYNGTGFNCDTTTGATGTDARSLICAGNRKFIWLEGSFVGSSATPYPFFIRYSSFVRVRKSAFLGGSTGLVYGLFTGDLTSSTIQESAFYGNSGGGIGLAVDSGSYNLISQVRTADNGQYGIAVGAGSHHNTLFQVISSNDRIAVQLDSTTENTLALTTTHNPSDDGVTLDNGASRNTLIGITSLNGNSANFADSVWVGTASNYNTFVNTVAANSYDGIHIDASSNNSFYDMLLAHNPVAGAIAITNLGGGNTFAGELLLGNNGTAAGNTCTVTGAGNSISASCTGAGLTVSTNVNLATTNSFVGKVSSNDGANLADSAGMASYATINAVTDGWVAFDSLFRGWGSSGGAFPISTNQGRCMSGDTCQIWDTRLRSTDALMLRKHGVFVADAACPASVDGNVTVTDQKTTPNTFLRHAVEVPGDLHNDGDGLCESNEYCLYLPNMGAYQGEGAMRSQSCVFSGGAVSGVKMFALPSNGV